MADLKGLSAATLEEAILKAALRAHESIQSETEAALAAVKDVTAALKDIPKAADDLVARAQAAFVEEIVVREGGLDEVTVHYDIWGQGSFSTAIFETRGESEKKPPMPAGRYRMLLFFIKLPDEKKG